MSASLASACAGVSRTTVSFVLSGALLAETSHEETRARVIAAARERGYVSDSVACTLAGEVLIQLAQEGAPAEQNIRVGNAERVILESCGAKRWTYSSRNSPPVIVRYTHARLFA